MFKKFIGGIVSLAIIAGLISGAAGHHKSADQTVAEVGTNPPAVTQTVPNVPTDDTTTQTATTAVAKPKPHPQPQPQMTESQKNAVHAANDYLATQAFSKQGLINQLSSSAGDGYPMADAVFAVNHIHVDWSAQAVKSAREYLSQQSFSRQDLIQQLSSSAGEGFTLAQAEYAVSKVY